MVANYSQLDSWQPQWLSLQITDGHRTSPGDTPTAWHKKVVPALMVVASNTPRAWLSNLDLGHTWLQGRAPGDRRALKEQLPIGSMLARCKWVELWYPVAEHVWYEDQEKRMAGLEEAGVIRVVS